MSGNDEEIEDSGEEGLGTTGGPRRAKQPRRTLLPPPSSGFQRAWQLAIQHGPPGLAGSQLHDAGAELPLAAAAAASQAAGAAAASATSVAQQVNAHREFKAIVESTFCGKLIPGGTLLT